MVAVVSGATASNVGLGGVVIGFDSFGDVQCAVGTGSATGSGSDELTATTMAAEQANAPTTAVHTITASKRRLVSCCC